MNIEQFPKDIKDDIEDQSLTVFDTIKDDIIVIGGWAVRAHLGEKHNRYTLDVDGVTDKDKLEIIRKKMEELGFKENRTEWGIQFLKKYDPSVRIPDELRKEIEKVEIRIEISEPRITETETPHYFKFSLMEYETREIPYHNSEKVVLAKVPSKEQMVAVKLGLPVDYKNNHDVAILLKESDLNKVIEIILENDDWREMVLRRLPKLIGRISQKGELENTLALAAGLDIRSHVKKLKAIETALK